MQTTHWQGEPVAVWEAVWGVPLVEAWTTLSSTNDRALELGRAGAPAWTVVVADHQSAGRGRVGRSWHSTPGAGLLVSVLLRPPAPARAGLLPLVTGVAMARAIEQSHRPSGTPATIGLKWPNDLWVGGGKCGGILCERSGDAVVVGIGVNLRPARASDGAPGAPPGATTLEDATGWTWSPSTLLSAFLREMRRTATTLPARFDGDLAAEWAARDVLTGRRVRVGDAEGTVEGVAPDGALRLRQSDGTITDVRAGHVAWTPPATPATMNGPEGLPPPRPSTTNGG